MQPWHSSQQVDPAEFCALALSRRVMVRADDAANGLRGLLDLENQVRYVVSEAELRNASCQPSVGLVGQ